MSSIQPFLIRMTGVTLGIIAVTAVSIILLGKAGLPSLAVANAADSSCAPRYSNATPIPSGYGASFSVVKSTHDPVITVSCSSNGATVLAESSEASHRVYIYKHGYQWNGTAWQPITLNGTTASDATDWIAGKATITFASSTLLASPAYNFVALYFCELDGTGWKCGCRDSFCAGNFWQLQAFRVVGGIIPPPVTTAGGTTSGTTGDSPIVPSSSGPFFGIFGNKSGIQSAIPLRLELYYSPRDAWSDIENPSYQLLKMQQNIGTNVRSVFSVALIPQTEVMPNKGQLYKCANGDYNSHFVVLANNLKNRGINNIIMRVGWEWTINSYYWAIAHDITHAPAFAKCYKNFVTTVDATYPQNEFIYDWNPNSGITPQLLDAAWPGDQYVDVVGLDIYDVYQGPNTCGSRTATGACRWNGQLYILNMIKNFAATHGKPISIPEWAVKDASTCGDACGGGEGGGDDPYFVQKMCEFMQDPSNHVLYNIYFDEVNANGDQTLRQSTHPLSRAAFLQYCHPNNKDPNTEF